MKKIILLLAALALSFGAFSCGGGGAGSSNTPPGENPGIPSVVQLSSSHVIAQTNSNITLHAKVLDGNGAPLKGVTVTFTNLSEPFGVLKPLAATTAVTNDLGIASMNLSSTTPGFATILAQVYNGVGTVRDRKSVFFTSKDVVAVSMDFDVDSVPGNEIFNQTDDITLFQDPPITQPDDTVKVRATVRDGGGNPVGGGWSVSWSSSHTEAVFLRQDTQTSTSGVAEAVVQVTPASIRNTDTLVNIMASAGNGAANMVTLFLRPVVIDPTKSSVTANPNIVDVKGASDVTAVVVLNTGARAPDGTVVNFSTAPKTAADPSPCGTITPFAQTKAGVTDPVAKFTAPSTPGICTVTAKSGGVIIGTVDITVIQKLVVVPDKATIPVGSTMPFTIFGGVPPFSVFSSDTTKATVAPATVTTAGGTFTVTAVAVGAATITVRDATGATATAAITVVAAAAPDFTVTCDKTALTVSKGTSNNTTTCTITSLQSFSSAVIMGCSALPGNPGDVTCTFAPPAPTPPANSTVTTVLTVTVALTAPTGTSAISIDGVSAPLTRSTSIALTIP
ncbi:MAG: Ig-like domain-containing protein [Nitrospirae bacterium]|nr:Ig-like domain-containing protein [Nitrospirota bacterium]